jgi:hypothetical protein
MYSLLNARRKAVWIVIGGVVCLFAFVSLAMLFRQDRTLKSTSSSPTVSVSPNRNDNPDNRQDTKVTQNLVDPSKQSAPETEQYPIPPAPGNVPPPLDEATHQKIVATIDAKTRETFRMLYGNLFQQLHLSEDLQGKVIDILTEPLKQTEQQAFEAARSGSIPALPSPEAIRAQLVRQNQQLQSVLGDAGFAQFDQYRVSIPDRLIINSMNQEGANLSDSQSQQVLQVLTEVRQQVMNPSAIGVGATSPEQARASIREQQVLVQQAVHDRVQNILTPEQSTTLQRVLSQNSIAPPKPQ